MSVLKVIKTDNLVMEYFLLPTVYLDQRFLYRFIQPVPTVWSEGKLAYDVPFASGLEVHALVQWKDIVLTGTTEGELPEVARWLLDIKTIEIHECKMVRVI
jgi:hypothetical protein